MHQPRPSRSSNRPPQMGGWGGRGAQASSSPLSTSTGIRRERRKMPPEIRRVVGRRPPRAAAGHAVFLDLSAAHHLLCGRSRIRPPRAPALPRRGQARSPAVPSCTQRIVRRGGRCRRLPRVASSGPPARAGAAGFGAARRSRGGALAEDERSACSIFLLPRSVGDHHFCTCDASIVHNANEGNASVFCPSLLESVLVRNLIT
jgi:hypothetical protein